MVVSILWLVCLIMISSKHQKVWMAFEKIMLLVRCIKCFSHVVRIFCEIRKKHTVYSAGRHL